MVVANEAGPGVGCSKVGPKTMAKLVAYMWFVASKSVTLYNDRLVHHSTRISFVLA